MRRAAAMLLVLAIVPGCGDARKGEQPAAARPAFLVASGDTAGWITPCGCAANQSGGLLRRGSYLADLRKRGDVIYADAGGAASGTSEYHKVKFEAILAGETQMVVAAHNLGASELSLGTAYVRDVARRAAVPLISANALDAATGQPLVETHRIVETAGRKTALVGVVSPRLTVDGIRITDPRQAVLATLTAIKGQYQSLIVLAYLPEDELSQFAAALPEADAVIGGPTGQAMTPRKVGPTLLAAATNKGKFLVQLVRDDPSGAWTP